MATMVSSAAARTRFQPLTMAYVYFPTSSEVIANRFAPRVLVP
jgi:hypothetical protein